MHSKQKLLFHATLLAMMHVQYLAIKIWTTVAAILLHKVVASTLQGHRMTNFSNLSTWLHMVLELQVVA